MANNIVFSAMGLFRFRTGRACLGARPFASPAGRPTTNRLESRASYPESAYVGAGAFRDALEANFGAVVDQRPQIVDLFWERDKVVLFGRESGIIKSTGSMYDIEFVQRFTFRNGRLAAVHVDR